MVEICSSPFPFFFSPCYLGGEEKSHLSAICLPCLLLFVMSRVGEQQHRGSWPIRSHPVPPSVFCLCLSSVPGLSRGEENPSSTQILEWEVSVWRGAGRPVLRENLGLGGEKKNKHPLKLAFTKRIYYYVNCDDIYGASVVHQAHICATESS